MSSSQKRIEGRKAKRNDTIMAIYRDSRSVFNTADIAMLSGESDRTSLGQKLNGYVRTGKLISVRRGIYAKPGYTPEEVACKVYTPSYISLEYVLGRAGVIFQYDSRITCVSYLSREVEIAGAAVSYRKLKDGILIETTGIERKGQINIATPERAFLEMLYLDSTYYFDNPRKLDRQRIEQLLPIFGSKKLTETVKKIFDNEQ
jgi:hypothetical protein